MRPSAESNLSQVDWSGSDGEGSGGDFGTGGSGGDLGTGLTFPETGGWTISMSLVSTLSLLAIGFTYHSKCTCTPRSAVYALTQDLGQYHRDISL